MYACTVTVGDALDNAMAESFFATLQVELFDRQQWDNRRQLAQAIFEYIEAWYNPRRRHSSLGGTLHVRRNGGSSSPYAVIMDKRTRG